MHEPQYVPTSSSNRRLLLQGITAAVLAAYLPARAQSGEAAAKAEDVSPVMRTVADYIVGAAQRTLPETAAEATRHHLLDTLAAMISGSRLLPGKKAIVYLKQLG